MTEQREKISLRGEQETLLVPLYAKAVESQRPDPIFVDRKAQKILEQIEYDFAGLHVPRKTAVMVCIRANKLDAYTRQFLAKHPQGIVLHLGCGLDSRCTRVDNRQVEWYDLDVPGVIDLRRRFYDETDRYHMIPSSVTDWDWIEGITAAGRPVLAVAEGLLMYLPEEEVKALILNLREAFPGCELAFDAFSTLTARSVTLHPSLKATGAEARWGIDDPTAIEDWAEGIRLVEEWYFTQAEEIKKLDFGLRLGFWLGSLFQTAKKAHRILYYSLQQLRSTKPSKSEPPNRR
jgi:O-methyltransferase involved in polyketide biosynthesis